MKNKKGFTILELMGAIIILSLVSAIIIPSVLSVIRRVQNNAYTEQIAYVIKAAEKWSVYNAGSFSETRNYYLSIEDLIAGGYLETEKLIDPRDNITVMNGCITIQYVSNQYSYDYNDLPCLGSPGSPGANGSNTADACFTFSAGTITNYTCGDTMVSIPEKINGVAVTAIDRGTFKNKGLVGINLPTGLLQIGNEAFSGNSLTRVVFPETLTYIGNSAFYKNKITVLTIPDSVLFIGGDAFINNKINTLTLGASLNALNANAFMDNQIRNLTIPNNVSSIGEGALAMNRITNVEIPASVTSFNCSAFEGNNTQTIKFLGGGTNITNLGDCKNDDGQYNISSIIVPTGSVNFYDGLDGTMNGKLNNWPIVEG